MKACGYRYLLLILSGWSLVWNETKLSRFNSPLLKRKRLSLFYKLFSSRRRWHGNHCSGQFSILLNCCLCSLLNPSYLGLPNVVTFVDRWFTFRNTQSGVSVFGGNYSVNMWQASAALIKLFKLNLYKFIENKYILLVLYMTSYMSSYCLAHSVMSELTVFFIYVRYVNMIYSWDMKFSPKIFMLLQKGRMLCFLLHSQ